MFDFFKKNSASDKFDAKSLRAAVLQFLKEELQQLEGGEGKGLKLIQLFVAAAEGERYLYEAGLLSQEPELLREEIQRIADNFAVDLPTDWKLTIDFVDVLPETAIRNAATYTGIVFKMASASPQVTKQTRKAKVTILRGKAEEDEYILLGNNKRINIGREKHIQVDDGSFRTNDIAFPEVSEFESNKYISRQHAHIEWDNQGECFRFFADEGGIPPGNKTKLLSAGSGSLQKLNSTEIGYPLNDADQLILGDVAVLEFTII